MPGTHRRKARRALKVSVWLGAGVTSAGVGAALLGGAAVANAAPTGNSPSTHTSSTRSTHSSPAGSTTKTPTKNVDHSAKHLRDAGHSLASAAPSTSSGHQRPAPTSGKPIRRAVPKAPTDGGTAQADEHSTTTPAKTDAALPAVANLSNTKGDNRTPSLPGLARKTISPALSDAVHEMRAALTGAAPSLTSAAGSTPAAATSLTTASGASATAQTTTTSAAAASVLATPETTNWIDGVTAHPGTYTALALQQISTAKTQLNTDTWGQGNAFAGLASLGAQADLAVAQWALTTWQTNNPGQMQAVANDANNPLAQAFDRAVLNGTQQLPGFAVFMLQSAASATPTITWFGVSSANATSATDLMSAAATNARVYGVVPLTMYAGTEPIVYVRVNGGPLVAVLVDTGSSGLVIGTKNVGQTGLGTATGTGAGAYAGGLDYTYTTYTTTVDFGNGIVTKPTAVDVVDASSESAFEDYISGNGVVGVLGIGANAVGPGPSIVTSALPGELADGVLIDQAGQRLVFGPNALPARTTMSGSPYALGTVEINGAKHPIWLLIDSGGVTGTIPSTVWSGSPVPSDGSPVPSGTTINVYAPDGTTLLYSYTTSSSSSPYFTTDDYSSSSMNTGNMPFSLYPVYIGYDTPEGTTVFDY